MSADGYAELALERLRERGFRITKGRRLVVAELAQMDRPLSPYAIHDRLTERGEAVDTVSIYRTLDTLEQNGLAHRVSFLGGYLACRLEHDAGCHHHLICRACQTVAEVHCPGMAAVEQGAAADSHFRIEQHLVEFVGLCPECQKTVA
jgi:Fe2+ or Zn2+ uptake regulation protein